MCREGAGDRKREKFGNGENLNNYNYIHIWGGSGSAKLFFGGKRDHSVLTGCVIIFEMSVSNNKSIFTQKNSGQINLLKLIFKLLEL